MDRRMSQVKVLVLLLIWCFHGGSSESTSQLLQRIAEQGFGKGFGSENRDRMDTLILWGISDMFMDGVHQLPYPKVVLDSASAMNESVRERCLVFMELKVTKKFNLLQLLNNAFADAFEHYKAKYVILLARDQASIGNIADIGLFFDIVNIADYLIALYASDFVGSIVYVRGSQLFQIRVDDPLDFIYEGRLKGLPFRVFFTESVPYAYLANGRSLSGVDVEIVKIIAGKLGVYLYCTLFDPLDLYAIYRVLRDRSVDMYLTRRGCNIDPSVPQIPLYYRSKVKLMMPRAHRINYNLQFFKPYKPEVWYLFMVFIAVAALLNWIFWKRLRLNFIMVIIFGHGQETSRLMAICIVAIQILKFIMLEAYLGQVTSFMIRLRYQENPQTLEQFFASDTMINEPPMMATFINQLPGNLPARMRNKLIDTHVTNGSSFYEPGFAYIVSEYAAYLLRIHHSGSLRFNSSFFYILDEPLLEIQMCYYFSLWSKFERKFVEQLGQLYANGIIVKILNDASRITRPVTEMNASLVLLFSDLVPVFLFLCYGLMLGVIALILELAFHQITARVRRTKILTVPSFGFSKDRS